MINLQKSGDIVIQPADKGSGICILDREDYIGEAERQLNDTLACEDGTQKHYYKKISQDKIKEQYDEIKEVLEEGIKNKYITKEFAKLMIPTKPKSGTFYMLPKVHKKFDKIPKGRPIISGSGSNTELISWFCDQSLKEAVKRKDSYVEDTPDILRFFEKINDEENLPENSKPIAIDIKSMYSNIPIDEGMEAFKEELEKRDDKSVPTEYYIKLLKLVLESNIFEFNREFYIQLLGTAMGTRVAPTYANIFMAKLEKFMLESCPKELAQLVLCWKRFIDDIFFIFNGSYEELDRFHNFLNSVHPTIKFDDYEHDQNNNSCNFLDLNIQIKDGKIITDLYRKETSKPSALLPSSAHPNHITGNIAYSLAFRLLRICSNEDLFESRLEELKKEFLLPRNFKSNLIDEEFEKVRKLPGDSFLTRRRQALEKIKRNVEEPHRIIAPMDFNPNLPNISQVLNKHHRSMLKNAPHLKEIFEAPPMASYRQPPNLRRLICKSKLHEVRKGARLVRGAQKNAPGWKKCGKGCKICPFTLPNTDTVTGLASGYQHKIKQTVTCDSENVIYYWKCVKSKCEDYPHCEYIGQTKRKFKDRLSEHRDYVKRDVNSEPSGEHFSKRGHNVAHLKGLVLEQVRNSDPFILKTREHLLIQKFDTFRSGLNKEP